MKKITHLTSVHSRYDLRIFIKECVSLAKKDNYEVNLIVADGKENEIKDGVHIYGVKEKYSNRFKRMLLTPKIMLKKALELDSDLYHFHDPELIGVGLKLKKLGKKVIFDSHELITVQILHKEYLPKTLRKCTAFLYKLYEKYACAKFDAIVTVSDYLKNFFATYNSTTCSLSNVPILSEFNSKASYENKENAICFAGNISEANGVYSIIKALKYTDKFKLILAGNFPNKEAFKELQSQDGWKNVEYLGYVSREEVQKIYARSKMGFYQCAFKESLHSLGTKTYEFMAVSIPTIAPNYEYTKSIFIDNQTGICADIFKDPKGFIKKIEQIIDDDNLLKKMGENGRKLVESKYNWAIEELKLYNLYNNLLGE